MKLCSGTPRADSYRMPGEYEPHDGCILIWPVRPGSWTHGGREAKRVFARIAAEIAASENVYMLCAPEFAEEAEKVLREACEQRETADEYPEKTLAPGERRGACVEHIHVVEIETDDAWARDVGPTFVVNGAGDVRGINWRFNAWGGDYDGLYADWARDDAAARAFLEYYGADCYDAAPFVLEGGSIHADGEGTLLVTEECLLSPGRNPELTKAEIETRLRDYLNVGKIIWLPCGIYNDETNGHVDNICAFTAPGEVVLAWTDDRDDPQYERSLACLRVLETEADARGRKIRVRRLPIPKQPVCITREDLDGLTFAPGEDTREVGERLAASYVNFYIANESVIVPQFGDENDGTAREILADAFPTRRIVPVYARDIIVGGGNIHCVTQQIPARKEACYE